MKDRPTTKPSSLNSSSSFTSCHSPPPPRAVAPTFSFEYTPDPGQLSLLAASKYHLANFGSPDALPIFFVQQKQRLVRRKDKHRCFSDSRNSDPKEAATKYLHHHCHTSQRLHTCWTTIRGHLTRHAPPPNSFNPTSSHENVSQSFATRVLPLVGHKKSLCRICVCN